VYVRDIARNEEIKISVAGGQQPTWNTEGRELFYRAPGPFMMSALIADRPRLSVIRRDTLFADVYMNSGLGRPSYDVFPGGREFLMMRGEGAADTLSSDIVLLQNWHLRARQAQRDGG
jgi:hypothetical protein